MHLDEHLIGAGTGSMYNLTDNVSIGIPGSDPKVKLNIKDVIIMSGSDRFIHNFGLENFFAGVNAGNLTMTGFGNVGVGEAALSSNTTGFDNTATGLSALAGKHHGRPQHRRWSRFA